jgi:hypothetical protein
LANGAERYQAWGNLLSCVKTEENLFYNTFKMIFYSYFKQNAEAVVNFNDWMKKKTKEWIILLFEAYDFS